jgi:FkbH-like protein
MVAIVKKITHEDSERISQLSMRSNQFNLRTVRYSYREVTELIDSPSYFTYTLRLQDKFGDHGLVAIAVVKKLDSTAVFLENFFMSCRVLKRGVEGFLINRIVRDIADLGIERLIGEYIRTPKNSLVENFLESHQFFFDGSTTILDVNKFSEIKNYIHES